MKVTRKHRDKVKFAITLATIVSLLAFITNLVKALKDWNIDGNEYQQLLTFANGFEATFLLVVLNRFKK